MLLTEGNIIKIIIVSTEVEFWIESDAEIDEDICIDTIPPPELSLAEDNQDEAELNFIVRWITALLSELYPESSEPTAHILACVRWPVFHPQHPNFGKPVEVYCRRVYEHDSKNRFILATKIASCAIFCIDKLSDEQVLIAVPFVE